MGRKNIIFGWLWLLCALLAGAYFQFKAEASGLEGMSPAQMMFWMAFIPINAGALAIMNIVYGYCLDQVNLSDRLKITAGLLAIMGTILFSGSFFLATIIRYELVKLIPLGTWCIILAIVILIVGFVKRT